MNEKGRQEVSFGLLPGGELSEEEEDGEVSLGLVGDDGDGNDDDGDGDDDDGGSIEDLIQVTPRAVLHSVREEKEPREGR